LRLPFSFNNEISSSYVVGILTPLTETSVSVIKTSAVVAERYVDTLSAVGTLVTLTVVDF